MLDILIDTLIDGIKLLPFLFITYLIMEYIEHKTNDKTKKIVTHSGKFGPLFGSFFGAFPQCGFSAAAANLYSVKIITIGTLFSIFLSTSDEMLPIFISESVPLNTILKILGIKILIGLLFGFLIDFFTKILNKHIRASSIEDICEHEHCHCENGILKSALKHTTNIFIFVILFSLILNILIEFIGEDNISNLILNKPILGPMVAGLIGLIPNCASSVIITKLYLSDLITVSTLISGLLVNAGVGLIVLFKANKNLKENLFIVLLLYTIGVISGIFLQFIGFQV